MGFRTSRCRYSSTAADGGISVDADGNQHIDLTRHSPGKASRDGAAVVKLLSFLLFLWECGELASRPRTPGLQADRRTRFVDVAATQKPLPRQRKAHALFSNGARRGRHAVRCPARHTPANQDGRRLSTHVTTMAARWMTMTRRQDSRVQQGFGSVRPTECTACDEYPYRCRRDRTGRREVRPPPPPPHKTFFGPPRS